MRYDYLKICYSNKKMKSVKVFLCSARQDEEAVFEVYRKLKGEGFEP